MGEEDVDFIPEDILEEAKIASLELLPEKSRHRYEKEYTAFKKWCNQRKVKTLKEEVFLAYFSQLSKTYKPSTLWSRCSMLKMVIKIKEDLDIGRFTKLTAFLKRQNVGYKAKKSKIFTKTEISKFMSEAPNDVYLMMKVATIFGLAGACRREELTYLTIDNIDDKGNLLVVKIPDTKTHTSRTFVISYEAGNGEYLALYRKYVNLRPPSITHRRFFIYYKMGKCSTQCVGINSFGKMPSEIAAYLGLPNPELYTGHSFRRSSATMLADSGANITNIKRHGGWKSTTVAEGYVEESLKNKTEISNKILEKEFSTTINNVRSPDQQDNPTSSSCVFISPNTNTEETSLSCLPSTGKNMLASAINLQNASNCNFEINIINQK